MVLIFFIMEFDFRDLFIGTQSARLFLFCKRSLPFLTVDTIIGNQASSHDRSNIFSVSF